MKRLCPHGVFWDGCPYGCRIEHNPCGCHTYIPAEVTPVTTEEERAWAVALVVFVFVVVVFVAAVSALSAVLP
jgi:hypothetical protein